VSWVLPTTRDGIRCCMRAAPDPAFLEAITSDPTVETVFLNMELAGVAVTLKKR
jgi:hypothetical protein